MVSELRKVVASSPAVKASVSSRERVMVGN
jgi:hypothetical protein